MLYALFKHLNKDFEIIKILPQKPTGRNPFSAIVLVGTEKKLVVIANTDVQKFYLKRSIEKQKEFYNDFSPYFKFNFPDCYGDLDDFSYAIYPYIENTKWCSDEKPINIIEKIYSAHAKKYEMTPALLKKIQADFLSAWPAEFHKQIKLLPIYKTYFKKISQKKNVLIYKEHGDYTVNNILNDGENLWLMDFEFAKDFQVTGCDLYDFQRTLTPRNGKKHGLSRWFHRFFHKTEKSTQKQNIDTIKIDLIDATNDIIETATKPRIELIEDKNLIRKVYPNFTYNRFDIRFGDDFKLYAVYENGKCFYIPYHIEKNLCILGVWLTPISKHAFDLILDDIFDKNDNVLRIQARYSLNQHKGLEISNHWRVELPKTIENFSSTLSARTRYNTSWYPKKIREQFGDYEIKKLNRDEITDDIVNRYFEFKKITHGSDYKMSPKQYLDTFYVTHAYVMYINNEIEAIIFNCLVDDIAYLENLSHNPELHKLSLGTVLYYYLITDLINQKVKYIYLGDGYQEYKKRFNGTNQLAFDGFIDRPRRKYKINTTRLKLAKKCLFKNKKLRKILYEIIKLGCAHNEKVILRKYMQI